MTTVDRKHPTYRDLLAALQSFDDEALDMPIKICDNEGRQSHAVFSYYHDFHSDAGPQITFKQVDEIKDDDLIRYTVVEDCDGEILGEEKTYPEIMQLCKKEDASIVSFDKEPDAYGTFYAHVHYNDI
tara:strand:+ start:631 stop:1014 length:384 start_codon:yes stop_codon:yes gene_type:complete